MARSKTNIQKFSLYSVTEISLSSYFIARFMAVLSQSNLANDDEITIIRATNNGMN